MEFVAGKSSISMVMTDIAWYKWPIEIDGLPIKDGGSFHGELLNNQMVFLWWICLFRKPMVFDYRRVSIDP